MTVFLDANVFVTALAGDEGTAACDEIVSAAASGALSATTSVGVAEEVWHLELSRPVPNVAGAVRRLIELMPPLLPIDQATLEVALTLPSGRLGAYDRLHAATCVLHGIDTIVTADKAFDELDRPRRLDPVDAVAELLA